MLDRIFALCAADATCAALYPDLRDRFQKVQSPAFNDFLQNILATSAGIAQLPRLIASGTLPPPAAPRAPPAPRGVFLSIICGEDIARIDTTTIGQATAGSFFTDRPIRNTVAGPGRLPQFQLLDAHRLRAIGPSRRLTVSLYRREGRIRGAAAMVPCVESLPIADRPEL